MYLRIFLAGIFLAPASAAGAQGLNLGSLLPEGSASASGTMIQLFALMTVLTLAPSILIMVTSYTRFIIAFSFLRSSLGLQSTPANLLLISLSLFMTFFVMAPTFDKVWENGVKPLTENKITEGEALSRVIDPFRDFMLQHVRPKDLQTMMDLSNSRERKDASAAQAAPGASAQSPAPSPAPAEEAAEEKIDMRVLVPAFMMSELRRGFEIGFLIALPFLIIDLIVAALVMSMGMMMMPPTVIALPFKILFFVLIDGWNLLVTSLVRSYF